MNTLASILTFLFVTSEAYGTLCGSPCLQLGSCGLQGCCNQLPLLKCLKLPKLGCLSGLSGWGCQQPSCGYSSCGLPSMSCGIPSMSCGIPSMSCGLPSLSGWSLPSLKAIKLPKLGLGCNCGCQRSLPCSCGYSAPSCIQLPFSSCSSPACSCSGISSGCSCGAPMCETTCCTHHIPVVEQCVSRRDHCFIRNVPVMKKVITPVVEQRTKLVPYQYSSVRHVAHSVCSQVPVVQRVSQPIVHNRIRYIPVAATGGVSSLGSLGGAGIAGLSSLGGIGISGLPSLGGGCLPSLGGGCLSSLGGGCLSSLGGGCLSSLGSGCLSSIGASSCGSPLSTCDNSCGCNSCNLCRR